MLPEIRRRDFFNARSLGVLATSPRPAFRPGSSLDAPGAPPSGPPEEKKYKNVCFDFFATSDTVGALDKECPPEGPDPGGFFI